MHLFNTLIQEKQTLNVEQKQRVNDITDTIIDVKVLLTYYPHCKLHVTVNTLTSVKNQSLMRQEAIKQKKHGAECSYD